MYSHTDSEYIANIKLCFVDMKDMSRRFGLIRVNDECANYSKPEWPGADPARVHWVHVHPPCVRVYVHSVHNARSNLNQGCTLNIIQLNTGWILNVKLQKPGCTLNFKLQKPECILNVKLQNIGCTPKF